jgi:hypothetical protein
MRAGLCLDQNAFAEGVERGGRGRVHASSNVQGGGVAKEVLERCIPNIQAIHTRACLQTMYVFVVCTALSSGLDLLLTLCSSGDSA